MSLSKIPITYKRLGAAYRKGNWIALPVSGRICANGKMLLGCGLSAFYNYIDGTNLTKHLAELTEESGKPTISQKHRLITYPIKFMYDHPADIGMIVENYKEMLRLIKENNVPCPVYCPLPMICEHVEIKWKDVEKALSSFYEPKIIEFINVLVREVRPKKNKPSFLEEIVNKK